MEGFHEKPFFIFKLVNTKFGKCVSMMDPKEVQRFWDKRKAVL